MEQQSTLMTQNHRMAEDRRALWKSPGPTPLLKQIHLEQAAIITDDGNYLLQKNPQTLKPNTQKQVHFLHSSVSRLYIFCFISLSFAYPNCSDSAYLPSVIALLKANIKYNLANNHY